MTGLPGILGSCQQYLGPHDVGLNEDLGIFNAPVHVGFGGKIDNEIKGMVRKQLIHEFRVRNITLYKFVIRVGLDIGQVFQIARISQCIQIDDLVIRMGFQHVLYKIGADEPGTTSH